MSSASSNIVFDDVFTINNIDKDGKKFDRVSRLYARSRNYDMDMTLDYNTEVFPVSKGQTVTIALASSLSRDSGQAGSGAEGADVEDKDVWRPDGKGRKGLEEDYEYVMYGKVYKFDGGNAETVTVYASFGGLLLSLTGFFRHMANIVLGDPIFILLRK
ncbi:RNA polymerase I [Pisolithus sp. B1]|nr:RNA polymerase I [Pisolithus sp. B1]